MHYRTLCLACRAGQGIADAVACTRCGGPLGFEYDFDQGTTAAVPDNARSGLWRWWRLLPVSPCPDEPVSLGEGATPLLASRLCPDVRLYWKDESRNPTGSHKDRAMALALTRGRLHGARRTLVVSAGSTGLANAAYAARAGLPSTTLVGHGVPRERLQPLQAYGTRLIEIDSGIDDVIEAARRFAGLDGTLVCSTTRTSNPYQAEAAKTIAYEVAEGAGGVPDWLFVPVGGGGTVAALLRGFQDWMAMGRSDRLPRIAAVVPTTYDALRAAWEQGIHDSERFANLPYRDDAPTILSKLSHAHPPDGMEALEAIRASQGVVAAVSDEEAAKAVGRVAATDGLYLEPSSCVVLPALERLIADGTVALGSSVVALACGGGHRETFVLAEREALRLERATIADIGGLMGLS